MSRDEKNKFTESIKKGFKNAYDEVSKSVSIIADKANKGAKEIALKLETPRLEKKKREVFEQIGEIIYETKDAETKEPTVLKKLTMLFEAIKSIEGEIKEINKKIEELNPKNEEKAKKGKGKSKSAVKKGATTKKRAAPKKKAKPSATEM